MRIARVLTAIACATVLSTTAIPAAGAQHPHAGPPPVDLSVTPSSATVESTPCGEVAFQVAMTNPRDRAIYTDVHITAAPALHLRQPVLSTYIPANTTVTDSVSVYPAADAEPGKYQVSLDAGKKPVTLPVKVAQPETSGDLARTATPTASSAHGGFMPCGAVDGVTDQANWGAASSGWNDGTKGQFPDWYQVTFDQAKQVSEVDLTTRDGGTTPASKKGLRDYDIQVKADHDWHTVASVRGNTQGTVRSRFDPVTTTAVRIYITKANDGYSRIMELEVYGASS